MPSPRPAPHRAGGHARNVNARKNVPKLDGAGIQPPRVYIGAAATERQGSHATARSRPRTPALRPELGAIDVLIALRMLAIGSDRTEAASPLHTRAPVPIDKTAALAR